MLEELRFNMCDLESSYNMNQDIPGLEDRVNRRIQPHLAYSCVHWASHLICTPESTLQTIVREETSIANCLEAFFHGPTVLYWIEALSLLGELRAGIVGLAESSRWIQASIKKLHITVTSIRKLMP